MAVVKVICSSNSQATILYELLKKLKERKVIIDGLVAPDNGKIVVAFTRNS